MELTISSSHFFCHFFLLQRENLYPAPMWGPSHELQFFIKCSIMVHFHRVPLQCKNVMESFRNCLLQWGSPMGSQVLPRKPAPAWASYRFTTFFSHLSALASSSMGCRWILLHQGPPWAGGAQLPQHDLQPQVAEASQLQHLKHLLLFLIH